VSNTICWSHGRPENELRAHNSTATAQHVCVSTIPTGQHRKVLCQHNRKFSFCSAREARKKSDASRDLANQNAFSRLLALGQRWPIVGGVHNIRRAHAPFTIIPRRVSWLLKAGDVGAAEVDEIMAQMPSFDIDKSQTMACTICPEAEHKMRYRLLVCSSEACSEAIEIKCAWRGKMLTCLESQHASIFEYGEHRTTAPTPAPKKLTTTQKAFCRELAENHLRPMRIRHALARKFATPLEELPSLKTVQNFVNHHGRTQMQNHDRVDELRSWIRERAYNGSELTNQAFTFAWEM
jgi:hypothetical protein